MSMGSRIKKLRIEKGFTQDLLGSKLGMGRSNVGHIENGRTIPTADTLDKIADILGTSSDYLLGRTDDESAHYYALNEKDEKDIAKRLRNMMEELESDASLAFMGEPMDEEDRELMRISLENTLRMSKQMAKKKFTPKKFRK